MIGLDSTAIIDLFRGDLGARKAIENAGESLASTIINYQELMFGLDFGRKDHQDEAEYYDRLFDRIFLLQLTKEAAKKAANVFKGLERTGTALGRFDSMIAGILIENGIKKIITRNTKHFVRIEGIEVITY